MSKRLTRRTGVDRPATLAGSADPAGRAGGDAFEVLAAVRADRVEADAREVSILSHAVTWARLHEVSDVEDAAQWFAPGAGAVGVAIAGEGAPLVAEWCVAEFATVLGLSTEAGKRLISEALELACRLPLLWARVQAGEVTAWRARRVAAETGHLSIEAAGFVDRQVAQFAHSITGPGIERLVAEAVARFMPEHAEQTAARAADGRCFEIDHQQVSFTGTSRVYGELDLADAIDLDTALAAGAEQLKTLGSTQTLDVRRAIAAGELARHQLALGFTTDTCRRDGSPDATSSHSTNSQLDGRLDDQARDAAPGIDDLSIQADATQPTQPGRPGRPVREVVIYAHLSAETITGASDGSGRADTGATGHSGPGFARVENTGTTLLTPAQVAAWCGIDAARITVRPVIDLNASLSSTSYEVPDRIREQIILRDRTCRFPWCNRTARRADIDHIVPWNAGGKTTTANLAALCRRHHRYKTHHGWDYRRTGPAAYEWTSPYGYCYAVGAEGTRALTPGRVPAPSLRAGRRAASGCAAIVGDRSTVTPSDQLHHRPAN